MQQLHLSNILAATAVVAMLTVADSIEAEQGEPVAITVYYESMCPTSI